MQKKYETLKRRGDFVKIATHGTRFFGKTFLMQTLQHNDSNHGFRVGYVASRKVGNAVRRNKAKRRLRELVRAYQADFTDSFDYVLIARRTMWDQPFSVVQEDFRKVLGKAVSENA